MKYLFKSFIVAVILVVHIACEKQLEKPLTNHPALVKLNHSQIVTSLDTAFAPKLSAVFSEVAALAELPESNRNTRTAAYLTPPTLGSIAWQKNGIAINAGAVHAWELTLSSLSSGWDQYAQLINQASGSGLSLAVVYKAADNNLYFVNGTGYESVGAFKSAASVAIPFNTSNFMGTSYAIPSNAKAVYLYVKTITATNYQLNLYVKNLILNIGHIDQSIAGCGPAGFSTLFCGPAAFEMASAYLNNRTPNINYVIPVKGCGTGAWGSYSNFLSARFVNDGFCNKCGLGTADPTRLRELAKYNGDQATGKTYTSYWLADVNSALWPVPDYTLPKEQELAYLRAELSQGWPVLIQVHIKMNTANDTHWMLARGLDNDFIYVNDPGSSINNVGITKYPISTFLKSWGGKPKKRCLVMHGGSRVR